MAAQARGPGYRLRPRLRRRAGASRVAGRGGSRVFRRRTRPLDPPILVLHQGAPLQAGGGPDSTWLDRPRLRRLRSRTPSAAQRFFRGIVHRPRARRRVLGIHPGSPTPLRPRLAGRRLARRERVDSEKTGRRRMRTRTRTLSGVLSGEHASDDPAIGLAVSFDPVRKPAPGGAVRCLPAAPGPARKPAARSILRQNGAPWSHAGGTIGEIDYRAFWGGCCLRRAVLSSREMPKRGWGPRRRGFRPRGE